MNNKDYSEEWVKQAQYDIDTAHAMLKAGRNIYCVFMCHLAIEKMALWTFKWVSNVY